MKFADILKQNQVLKYELANKEKIDLVVLSNITLNQLIPVLEFLYPVQLSFV